MSSRLIGVTLMTITLGFLLALSFAVPSAAHAEDGYGGCAATYTVQRGDTLFSIAVRHNTSVSNLMRLNYGRVWNPNIIYTGQVLCVPETALDVRTVTLEATYQYSPTLDEKGWNLTTRGGYLGLRIVYPIRVVDFMSTTAEILTNIQASPAPVLVGIRNDESGKSYTLVSIGRPDIFSSLRLTGTVQQHAECVAAPEAGEALNSEAGKLIEPRGVVLWMEAGQVRYPFYVENIDAMSDLSRFTTCYTGDGKDKNLAFALFPARSGPPSEYRLLMLLQGNKLGPPGADRAFRCSLWSRTGWFSRWLRAWYGCAR